MGKYRENKIRPLYGLVTTTTMKKMEELAKKKKLSIEHAVSEAIELYIQVNEDDK